MPELRNYMVTIVELHALRLVGCRYQGPNENNEIPRLWGGQFLPRLAELGIDRSKPFGMYGAERDPEDGQPGDIEYLAAVQVSPDQPIPEGMVAWDVPAHTWAVCRVDKLENLGKVWTWLAGTWLPSVEAVWRPAPVPWLEVYPETHFQDNSLDLYCPVVPA